MNILDYIGTRYLEFATSLPTISGIAESEIGKAGTIAELYIGDKQFILEVDSATGMYRWEAIEAFIDGSYSASLRFRDAAGNYSEPLLINFIIDTTPPAVPDLLRLYDDVGPHQSVFEPGDTIDDKRPTLTGIAQKGSIVYLLNEFNERIGSAITDETGKWELEPSQDLREGNNNLRLVAEEFFAREYRSGEPTEVFTIIVSTTADKKPTIDYAYDDVGQSTGNLVSGATTDDTRPQLFGSAEANSTFSLRYKVGNGSYTTISLTADSAGTWNWNAPLLRQGNWTFQVQKAGQNGWESFTLKISSIPEAPSVPVIVDFYDDFGSSQGPIPPNDQKATTDDHTPTLRGTATANSIVYIQFAKVGKGWSNLGSVRADDYGKWTFTPNPLESAAWQFRVKAGNAGGESKWATKVYLNIEDSEAHLAPLITSVVDNFGPVMGVIGNGGFTDDRNPLFNGTAAAGVTSVLIYRNGSQIAKVAVFGGKWSWEGDTSAFAFGSHSVTVRGVNAAGELSDPSPAFNFTVSGIPAAPKITHAYDDAGMVHQNFANGGTTDDRTPTLHGIGVPGSQIKIEYSRSASSGYGLIGTTVVNADGTWGWTTPQLNENGAWYFRAQAVNGHGSSGFNNFYFIIDPNVDLNPSIDYAYDNVGPSTGELKGGATTDDSTPTLHGTSTTNSVVYIRTVMGSSETIYSVTSGADGKWQWTPPTRLTNGNWDFQVSKTATGGWGSVFDLNIENNSSFTGFIDFEEGTPEGVRISGYSYATEYKYDNLSFSTYGIHSTIKFISTDFIGEPSFGKTALKFNSSEYLRLLPKQDANFTHYIKNFGFDLYNDQPQDTRLIIYLTTRTEQGYRKTYTIHVIFKPGITTFTLDDVPEGEKPTMGEVIEDLQLLHKYVPSGSTHNFPVYIDNIGWSTKGSNGITSFATLEDDSIHHVAGAETLNNEVKSASQFAEDKSIIDLTANCDNVLKLDLKTILQQGEKELFIEDGKTQLMVKGDINHVVELKDILAEEDDISEWQQQIGNVTVAGVKYNVYSHGEDAELLVQQGVKTELD